MKRFVGIGVAVLLVGAGVLWWFTATKGATSPKTADNGVFVALGDSVAAGVGLPTASDASACNRTDEGYPKLLAVSGKYTLSNLSCSGASLENGVSGVQTVNGLALDPQLDRVLTMSPKLITLTIGANDVGWIEFLTQCYQGVCDATLDQTVSNRLETFKQTLTAVLTTIKTSGTVTPPTYVTGYYSLFPADGTSCRGTTGVELTEQQWFNQQLTRLNSTIEQTVKDVGYGTYVPVDFAGHELCTKDPWVQGLSDKAAYHPTTAGQKAFAASIEKAMEGR